MKSSPVVTDYFDAIQFLKEYYQYRKATEKIFSFDTWATELGFKSKSYLRMILFGRRKITPSFEVSFAKAARFEASEIEYFHFMVLYSQSNLESDRRVYSKKMTSILRDLDQPKEVENYFEFVSDPSLPTLLTLLSFVDIKRDDVSLNSLMNETLEFTQQRLITLEKLGLAAKNADDEWVSNNRVFRVPNGLGDRALISYHRENLKRAAEALSLDPAARRFRTLLLPLSEEEIRLVHEQLNSFAHELLGRFQSDEYSGRQLYKLNLSLYPVEGLSSSEFTKEKMSSADAQNLDFVARRAQ